MIFKQLFDTKSSTYTYFISSGKGRESLIIDPVLDNVNEYIKLLEELDLKKIHFLLMPLIHSEDISDHIFGHKLIDTYLQSFEHFKKIKKAWDDHTIPIKKFGRYPHRNKILNRDTTEKEELFLKQPDSSW